MVEKMKIKKGKILLILLLMLFLKNAIDFFLVGGDENPVSLILFYLIIILALILAFLYKE